LILPPLALCGALIDFLAAALICPSGMSAAGDRLDWLLAPGTSPDDSVNAGIAVSNGSFPVGGSNENADREEYPLLGGEDAWIAKIGADGMIVWETYLG
jgi:hypothetical protein